MNQRNKAIIAASSSLLSFALVAVAIYISTFLSFVVFFFINFSLQWWLMKWIAMLEEDETEKSIFRFFAKALLLCIPAFYLFGSILLGIFTFLYLIT